MVDRSPTCRLFGLVAVALLAVAPLSAVAQSKSPLEDLKSKDKFTAAESDRIVTFVQDQRKRLESSSAIEQREGRDALLSDLADPKATPQFRAEGARIAARVLSEVISSATGRTENAITAMGTATNSCLVLAELGHPATRDALMDGLSSPAAAVRYLCASGLAKLRPQLTTPEAYRDVLTALADQGMKESDHVVLRMIYRAMNFAEAIDKFPGGSDMSIALNKVFGERIALISRGGAVRFEDDIPGFKAAFRTAAVVTAPPVLLMNSLARILKIMVSNAAAQPGSVPADAVEELEAAIAQLMSKHGGSAQGVTKIAPLIRRNADAKTLNAALDTLIGSATAKGALNAPPWNVPQALARNGS